MRRRDRVGLLLGALLFVVGLFMGVELVSDPVRCDGQAMAGADRCVSTGRHGERLIVGGGLSNPETGRSPQAQVVRNRVTGGVFIAAGVLSVAVGSWAAWGWMADRRQVRRFQRGADPRAP